MGLPAKKLPQSFRVIRDEADIDAPLRSAPVGITLDLRLSEFYAHYVLPVFREGKSADAKTLKQDRESLAYWIEFTGDPPMRLIDEVLCAAFVKRLKKQPGLKAGSTMAGETVRKHCTHIQTILDRAGPRNRRNRSGQSLFRDSDGMPCDAPYLERAKKRLKPANKDFKLMEIGAWLDACDYAIETDSLMGKTPRDFWRALVIFCWNTGLRIDTVMELTWAMVDAQEPDWIEIPGAIYKGGRQDFSTYLNAHARSAIESIHALGQERLFPWFNWPASQGWLQACRRKILAKTVLPPHRRFGFHGLRRALITYVSPKSSIVAKMIAGHSGPGHHARLLCQSLGDEGDPRRVAPARGDSAEIALLGLPGRVGCRRGGADRSCWDPQVVPPPAFSVAQRTRGRGEGETRGLVVCLRVAVSPRPRVLSSVTAGRSATVSPSTKAKGVSG